LVAVRLGRAPDRQMHLAVAEPLQERKRSATADLDLGERRLVEEAGALTRGAVLGGDSGRPVMPGPARRPRETIHRCPVRLEPIGPLPPRFLAEGRTERGQAR